MDKCSWDDLSSKFCESFIFGRSAKSSKLLFHLITILYTKFEGQLFWQIFQIYGFPLTSEICIWIKVHLMTQTELKQSYLKPTPYIYFLIPRIPTFIRLATIPGSLYNQSFSRYSTFWDLPIESHVKISTSDNVKEKCRKCNKSVSLLVHNKQHSLHLFFFLENVTSRAS